MYGVFVCLCKTEREGEGEPMYVLFSEKNFYPTHTINQLQTKQPLSSKAVLLPYSHPFAEAHSTHTRTHTLNFFTLTLFNIHR